MLIAITGTPGCGKTTVSTILIRRGYHVISVNRIIEQSGIATERDHERDTNEVDIEQLIEAAAPLLDSEISRCNETPENETPDIEIPATEVPCNETPHRDVLFIDGHLSHYLPVDAIVILRVSPAVIAQRLAPRGYSDAKIRENREAEAMGIITGDVLAARSHDGEVNGKSDIDHGCAQKVYELDVTSLSPDSVADIIESIVHGNVEEGQFAPGGVDWSEEILSWY